MRIIAGQFKGRSLLPPPGDVTRPITDRVKQSLFDIIAPLLPGSVVYDCFAGTGSMGLESLSRDAKTAVFFEQDRPALARLRQNIIALGVADRSQVIQGDLFRWFNLANTRPEAAKAPKADLVFLDPPYRFLTDRPDELLQLALYLTRSHLNPNATVIFRHDTKDTLELPNLRVEDKRDYGGMALEFLRPVGE
jgi:16S rRNA (guanine966-N2)-methyltransferase